MKKKNYFAHGKIEEEEKNYRYKLMMMMTLLTCLIKVDV